MHFFFVQAYRGLKSCTSFLENVSLRVPTRSVRTSQRLAFVPLTNTVLLLGAPMQPTWWGNNRDVFAVGAVSLCHIL
jgi:hypothetical protein